MTFAERVASGFRSALKPLGFAFFDKGDYNINLIGVRSVDVQESGEFDDAIACLYKVNDIWRAHLWPMTTDPSTYYLNKPINDKGAAILAHPQQARGAYKIGKHKGYPALVQHGGPVRVWRDGNTDDILDWGEDEGTPGWYGINIHRAKPDDITDDNDYYSAGCQVMPVKEEHDALMDIVRMAISYGYNNRFTYTMVTTKDL